MILVSRINCLQVYAWECTLFEHWPIPILLIIIMLRNRNETNLTSDFYDYKLSYSRRGNVEGEDGEDLTF